MPRPDRVRFAVAIYIEQSTLRRRIRGVRTRFDPWATTFAGAARKALAVARRKHGSRVRVSTVERL